MKPSEDRSSPVSLFHDPGLLGYPLRPPFDPPNPVYAAVCQTLRMLGLDAAGQGGPGWNPLGELVAPGGRVVIKPNLVDLKQGWIALGGERVLDMVTHGSVLRPLIDHAYAAVGSEGRIVVCDAPLVHADFEGVVARAGIAETVDALRARGVPVELRDLREVFFERFTGREHPLSGDPLGNSIVDLGTRSALAPLDSDPPAVYFTLADQSEGRAEPMRHHYRGRHEYCIPNTILGCDLFVNVPKLKTHVKTGVTLSLKNLMGITHFRGWMPHHRSGTPPGGDEFPVDPGVVLRNRERLIQRIARLPGGEAFVRLGAYARHAAARLAGRRDRTVIHGGWYGNDTLWRTLVDLNRVLLYGRPGGELVEERRAYLSLVDGIIAGEGNGPVKPRTRPVGVLAASCDPVALDAVLAWKMGFDPERIRLIQGAGGSRAPLWLGHASLDRVSVESNLPSWRSDDLDFAEPLGWEGYLKRSAALSAEMLERLEQMPAL